MSVHNHSARLTPARRRLLDALLEQLLDMDSAGRERRLDGLAGRCPRIHARLRRLVDASLEPTRFLEPVFERVGQAALEAQQEPGAPLPAGTRIGGWRLIEPAGAGGMGMVYRAERADGAFEMTAAIKFIRTRNHPDMAERLVLETRLLARLSHPNIARILDGGTLPDGQNYLVMEWIDGEDLAQCRDKTALDWHGCFRLFGEIAGAVAHAHQRQIAHGDIKPANIRVAADGRPRLLDFGVARMFSGEDDADARTTALTPAFSAPEQLEGAPPSTQTDIYSLGALLHWMVTGDARGEDERIAPERIPAPRPRAVAAIIERATARDPGDRYRSVPELIDDIEALCEMRPVAATSPGPALRAALWARRHRLAAGLAAMAFFAVIAGIGGITWQARIAAAERDAARFEAERSTLLREQLVMLFREVGRNADQTGQAESLSTRELLDESVRLAERLYANDPQMLVNLKVLLGELYIAMNDFAAAEPLLEAFVNHRPNRASALMQALARADLAQIRLRQGDSERALELTDAALETLRKDSGGNLRRIADAMQVRGQALRGLGRWEQAIETLKEALRLARREPGPTRLKATAANNLATTLIYAGRADEALPHLRSALNNWRALGLSDGSDALTVMANLAGLLHQRGRLDEAEPLYREAIRERRRRFGESGALAAVHLNLGSLLATRNRIAEAREHIERGVRMIRRFEGDDSVSYARALLARGRMELAAGRFEPASGALARARERFRALVGDDHLFTRITEMHAARAAIGAGVPDAGRRLADAVEALETRMPAAGRHLAVGLCALAKFEIDRDVEAALRLAQRCLALRRDRLGLSDWQLAEARAIALAARIELGDREAAEALREARATIAAVLGDGHPMLAWCDRWLNA